MAKIKKSLMGGSYIEPIKKKTTQGSGQHSRPKPGRKKYRGQGR
tara:strand:+ start:346 stop:477 length:132 start_codon:yes stop_codon:yes gene_type:complete